MKSINIMVNQMNSDLNGLGYTDLTAHVNSEKALECLTKTFEEIRTYVMKNGFKSSEDEIEFFKTVRPEIASRISLIAFVIEYKHISNISEQMKADLIEKKSNHFKQIMADNKNYLVRMSRNIREDNREFFIRHGFTPPVNSLGKQVLLDPNFLTYHSLLLEILKTDELIQSFLNEIKEKPKQTLSSLIWTGNKTSLIELMYGLYYAQTLNNGNIDLKLLTKAFEEIFNVHLGDVYRTFHEIKNRNESTIFLNKLKLAIQNKIDEDEGFFPE